MAKLKQIQNPTIDPDLITFIFLDDRKYAWRRENDITIDPNDTAHPLYKHYDPRVLLPVSDQSIANAMAVGINDPIVLFEAHGYILCKAGLQRTKRCRLANAKRETIGEPKGAIPYQVKQTGDNGVLDGIGISTNYHRTDDDYVTSAETIALKMLQNNWDKKTVAMYCDCTVTAINQKLDFLKLAPEVIRAVKMKKLAPTTALTLKHLSHEQQFEALEEILAGVEGVTLKTDKSKPKQASGKTAKQVAAKKAGKAEPTVEEAEAAKTKAFHKAVALLMAMDPLDRVKVLQIFDPETGEEIALATRIGAVIADAEAEQDKEDVSGIYAPEKTDDETRELTTEYDDQITEAEGQPTVKRRSKKASSRK